MVECNTQLDLFEDTVTLIQPLNSIPIGPITGIQSNIDFSSGAVYTSTGTGSPVWTTTTTAPNPYTAMGAGQMIQPSVKVVIQG